MWHWRGSSKTPQHSHLTHIHLMLNLIYLPKIYAFFLLRKKALKVFVWLEKIDFQAGWQMLWVTSIPSSAGPSHDNEEDNYFCLISSTFRWLQVPYQLSNIGQLLQAAVQTELWLIAPQIFSGCEWCLRNIFRMGTKKNFFSRSTTWNVLSTFCTWVQKYIILYEHGKQECPLPKLLHEPSWNFLQGKHWLF